MKYLKAVSLYNLGSVVHTDGRLYIFLLFPPLLPAPAFSNSSRIFSRPHFLQHSVLSSTVADTVPVVNTAILCCILLCSPVPSSTPAAPSVLPYPPAVDLLVRRSGGGGDVVGPEEHTRLPSSLVVYRPTCKHTCCRDSDVHDRDQTL